jgi:hypothetical protein
MARQGREGVPPQLGLSWAPAWRSPTPPPGWFQLLLLVSHSFLFLAVWLSNWTFDFSVLGFNLILYLGQQEHLLHDAIIPICNDTFMYPSPPECRTIRNLLEHSRWKHRNHSRTPKRDFPYMNLILRTIPDHLVISRIPSKTPNNIRSLSHNTITTQTTSNP